MLFGMVTLPISILEHLNERYDPDFNAGEESYIYLCSHNKLADDINQQKLAEIKVDPSTFEAKLFGEFKENQYPE